MLKMQHKECHLLLSPRCNIGMYTLRREVNLEILSLFRCNPCQFLFRGPCRAIKSYNFRTSVRHQGMAVVENNPVV